MSSKPSLYVVERKEVVVLVTLFVLVTVLAFTLGVKYGESLGRKAYLQDAGVQHKMQEDLAGHGGSGTIGSAKEGGHGEEPKAADGDAPKHDDGHGTPPAVGHGETDSHGKPADKGHGEAPKADGHGNTHADPHGDSHSPSPEELAKAAPRDEPKAGQGLKDRPKEPVDTNSDAHLLKALRDAGIQPSKGGAVVEAKDSDKATKLPHDAKTPKPQSGAYTIQVGSYPTRSDAEAQLRRLKDDHLAAMMMAPVTERNGEWFRVTVGNYTSKVDADRAAKQFQAKGQIKNYFVRKVN